MNRARLPRGFTPACAQRMRRACRAAWEDGPQSDGRGNVRAHFVMRKRGGVPCDCHSPCCALAVDLVNTVAATLDGRVDMSLSIPSWRKPDLSVCRLRLFATARRLRLGEPAFNRRRSRACTMYRLHMDWGIVLLGRLGQSRIPARDSKVGLTARMGAGSVERACAQLEQSCGGQFAWAVVQRAESAGLMSDQCLG